MNGALSLVILSKGDAAAIGAETVAAGFMVLLSIATIMQGFPSRKSNKLMALLSITTALLLLLDAFTYTSTSYLLNSTIQMISASINFIMAYSVACLFHYYQINYIHELS